MEQGWDTDVKAYFVDILKAISWGLIWMIFGVSLGLYYKLAFGRPVWASALFYVFQLSTLILLVRYYVKMWNKDRHNESRTAEDIDER